MTKIKGIFPWNFVPDPAWTIRLLYTRPDSSVDKRDIDKRHLSACCYVVAGDDG